MVDISLNQYDEWRAQITRMRAAGKSWEQIRFGGTESEEGLKQFIHNIVSFTYYIELSVEVWYALVESQKAAEEEQEEINIRTAVSMLTDDNLDNGATIPTSPGSSWQLYRKRLAEESHFSEPSIKQVESSCFRILKRLSNDTTQIGPVKGLVIGNVQSGKTANMAGLMAMAADNGWNMFIILSGTIENLRLQTETRLNNDLNSGEGNLIWQPLGKEDLKLKKRASTGQTRHLQLGSQSKRRYFAVCLKNKTRLTNLIKWLQGDPNAQQNLRILIIDDEADQASINTGNVYMEDDDRKAINKLIVNLVEDRTHDGKPCAGFYRAVNYVCYTATPYANFLNENYPKSLYPKDFLISLQPSDQYFGPVQIFGTDEEDGNDGMNIVRSVIKISKERKARGETDDFSLIKDIHENGSLSAPDSLWDSIAWFLCSVSAMRYIGYKKPISMLVHTSTKTGHHANFAGVIRSIICPANKEKLIDRCERVYSYETAEFTKNDLRTAYPSYERSWDSIPDYPPFEAIRPGIELLIDTEMTAIQLNEERDEMHYHAGVHLCIDNCANNGIGQDNTYVRLVYPPDDYTPYPSPAPAFIVIGGNTLSRGLTIQGLVSTYFAREVKQADSLMQMARWFGYRQNYELFPRIWMSDETKEKFVFMTQLDCELRDELKQYHIMGKKPLEYGPGVKNTPKAGFLQITAKNRMQMAEEVDFDFAGVRTETISFPNVEDVLRHNLSVTESFIRSLPMPISARKNSGYIWRNIEFSEIRDALLSQCKYATEGKVFNQLETFLAWIDKVTADGFLTTWNVAVAGGTSATEGKDIWTITDCIKVRKIRRNDKLSNTNPDLLNVGAVRDPKDLVIDIDESVLQINAPEMFAALDTKSYIINNHYQIRSKCGYDTVPLLIIYLIDKDSEPSNPNSTTRRKLNAKADVAAFSITIPGLQSKGNLSQKLQIRSATTASEEESEEE